MNQRRNGLHIKIKAAQVLHSLIPQKSDNFSACIIFKTEQQAFVIQTWVLCLACSLLLYMFTIVQQFVQRLGTGGCSERESRLVFLWPFSTPQIILRVLLDLHNALNYSWTKWKGPLLLVYLESNNCMKLEFIGQKVLECCKMDMKGVVFGSYEW